MKTVPRLAPPGPLEWEYVVEDLLELSSALKPAERQFLVDALKSQRIQVDAIEIHPAFSMGKCMVIVREDMPAETEECWVFLPREKKIKKLAW